MTTLVQAAAAETQLAVPELLWLDLTRKCQLQCVQCYNASGPEGSHGTMSREDWTSVLEQAATCGVRRIQYIGGEPTMHPDFPDLVNRALNLGLNVEVYSNLVHVSAECWELFQRDGLTLATSYYSDDPAQHNAMTGRPSHARTRANIVAAVQRGIPVRVGVIAGSEAQRVNEARQELEALGVAHVRVDHVRPFGRGANGQAPDASNLCGRCGSGRAAISPTGDVSPCVFSGWLSVGNVKETPLADILSGPVMVGANASIRNARGPGSLENGKACTPDTDDECSPGTPGSECTPKN
ncbi:radical SAM/SPASM domain-containing protein [Streptomyces sp. NBC_01092]|uniref:radical SAM/SPASM domain-containing protein n=1 Tax=Streptomyces sp. NBC_01092 TaxID=2903748 RepID=UPI00386B0B31|nr:radical SAM protein [Streptomyces sp. NBC_01092]